MTNYEFGDIVLVAFPQSGISQRKRRPALVILDIGDADVVILKVVVPPNLDEFRALIKEARRQAKEAGLRQSDVTSAVGKARRRK